MNVIPKMKVVCANLDVYVFIYEVQK